MTRPDKFRKAAQEHQEMLETCTLKEIWAYVRTNMPKHARPQTNLTKKAVCQAVARYMAKIEVFG